MDEWQGLIFAIGSLIFAPSLLIMVWNNVKTKRRIVPLFTSVPTTLVLWIYVGTYFTMGESFAYAAITTGATALMWTLLMVGRNEVRRDLPEV